MTSSQTDSTHSFGGGGGGGGRNMEQLPQHYVLLVSRVRPFCCVLFYDSLRSPYPNSFHPFPSASNLPRRYQEASQLQDSPHLVKLPIFVPKCKKIQFCGQYNKNGRCSAACHPVTHRCNKPGCGGSHPGRTCPSFTKFN